MNSTPKSMRVGESALLRYFLTYTSFSWARRGKWEAVRASNLGSNCVLLAGGRALRASCARDRWPFARLEGEARTRQETLRAGGGRPVHVTRGGPGERTGLGRSDMPRFGRGDGPVGPRHAGMGAKEGGLGAASSWVPSAASGISAEERELSGAEPKEGRGLLMGV
jgi:hypothetical protein